MSIKTLDISDETLPDITNNEIFQFEIELDNKELEDVALNMEKTNNGVKYSNIGGWHSKNTLFESCKNKSIIQLHNVIINCASKILKKNPEIRYSWININRNGNKNKQHTHGKCLAACYYVLTDNKGGEFVASDLNIKILPSVGTLLMFHGKMKHEVLPYTGDHHRISIACNIY